MNSFDNQDIVRKIHNTPANERDKTLVAKFQQGDMEAFEEIMSLYENQIYGFLIRMCRCGDGAKDVLQNTFLNVYRYLPKFRGEASLKTWIYKIASTSCLKEKRKKKAEFDLTFEDFLPNETSDTQGIMPQWAKTPVEELLNKELLTRLKDSLVTLPDKYRIVLVLRDLEGFSAEETAQSLDISIPAVKSRLHRARLFVRKELNSYYKERSNV